VLANAAEECACKGEHVLCWQEICGEMC